MNDAQCVQFLQWALPQLQLRWAGFRRVRSQVCKRLQRRLKQLQLQDLTAYRKYLIGHDEEWSILDSLCQITVSRFYRDKMVFSILQQQVFPYLLHILQQRDEHELRIWSAGCGAGEEPYTLAMMWDKCFQADYPAIRLSLLATDSNPLMLQRAEQACYPYSAIKNLPPAWLQSAFTQQDGPYCLHSAIQNNVEFRCQDIRTLSAAETQQPPFHLLCCRNLAFTYYDQALQIEMMKKLHARLVEGGVLLLGIHERLPPQSEGFEAWSERLAIYLRR